MQICEPNRCSVCMHIEEDITDLAQRGTELDPPQSTETMNLHFFPAKTIFSIKVINCTITIKNYDHQLGSPLQNKAR